MYLIASIVGQYWPIADTPASAYVLSEMHQY